MLKNAICLTGGIASGKSSACSLLKLYGFRVIDADKIAHEVLESQADTIASTFGGEYVVNGKVDRKALGKLVFANKAEREKLEAIVHPKIKEQVVAQALKQEELGKPYIVDLPLFFEREGVYDIDKVVVVYTPQETQLERLIKREGLSETEAKQRIDAQLPIELKKEKATFVIDNSKDLAHLQRECERVKEEILNACS
jgi:dephospho-CoA kinase